MTKNRNEVKSLRKIVAAIRYENCYGSVTKRLQSETYEQGLQFLFSYFNGQQPCFSNVEAVLNCGVYVILRRPNEEKASQYK